MRWGQDRHKERGSSSVREKTPECGDERTRAVPCAPTPTASDNVANTELPQESKNGFLFRPTDWPLFSTEIRTLARTRPEFNDNTLRRKFQARSARAGTAGGRCLGLGAGARSLLPRPPLFSQTPMPPTAWTPPPPHLAPLAGVATTTGVCLFPTIARCGCGVPCSVALPFLLPSPQLPPFPLTPAPPSFFYFPALPPSLLSPPPSSPVEAGAPTHGARLPAPPDRRCGRRRRGGPPQGGCQGARTAGHAGRHAPPSRPPHRRGPRCVRCRTGYVCGGRVSGMGGGGGVGRAGRAGWGRSDTTTWAAWRPRPRPAVAPPGRGRCTPCWCSLLTWPRLTLPSRRRRLAPVLMRLLSFFFFFFPSGGRTSPSPPFPPPPPPRRLQQKSSATAWPPRLAPTRPP